MIGGLSLKNLTGRPGRTAALAALAALMALSIFGGSLLVTSFSRGLDGLEARLGADIIVVPYEASTKFNVNSLLLQGNPGYFYMRRSYVDKIAQREGVEAVSSQLYLASVTSGCCSMPVQLVGFDPETDFTIRPWIQETYRGEIAFGDVLVGSDISLPLDGVLTFYGVDCRVAGQLAQTGSALDQAVYANEDTIEALIEASQARGLNQYNNISAQEAVSSVLIRVKDGYDVEAVKDDINIHVRKVVAVRAGNMITSIAQSLGGASRLIVGFIALIWLLCLAIMTVAFTMIMNERRGEFALLRMMGATRRSLAGLVASEALIVCLAGGVVGSALAALILFPFSRAIGAGLNLPFAAPDAGSSLALLAATLLACGAAGALACAISAVRVSRMDAGVALREGR